VLFKNGAATSTAKAHGTTVRTMKSMWISERKMGMNKGFFRDSLTTAVRG
jgi:hypothetical protein